MIPDCAIPIFAIGKGADEFDDPAHEEQAKGQNCSNLDDDGVHLPVSVGQVDVQQRLGDAQMSG